MRILQKVVKPAIHQERRFRVLGFPNVAITRVLSYGAVAKKVYWLPVAVMITNS